MTAEQNFDQKWRLVESESLDRLYLPIQLNSSLQYTCLDVSTNYIWCGSSAGNVYVFDKKTLKHAFLLRPPTCGTTSQIRAAATEALVGFSDSNKVFVSRPSAAVSEVSEALQLITGEVTQIAWNSSIDRLYVGTSNGEIYSCLVLTSKVFIKTQLLCKFESSVYQIDYHAGLLLISTAIKTIYLCISTSKQIEIGKKPRNGKFGAAFLQLPGQAICYCARPGFRLWEVDASGTVLNTHNFKSPLNAAETPIIHRSSREPSVCLEMDISGSFQMLLCIRKKFLVSICGGRVIVLDPISATVLLWSYDSDGVSDFCCMDSSLFILTKTGFIRRYELVTLEEHVASLPLSAAAEAARLCMQEASFFRKLPQQVSYVYARLREAVGCYDVTASVSHANITLEPISVLNSLLDSYQREFSGILSADDSDVGARREGSEAFNASEPAAHLEDRSNSYNQSYIESSSSASTFIAAFRNQNQTRNGDVTAPYPVEDMENRNSFLAGNVLKLENSSSTNSLEVGLLSGSQTDSDNQGCNDLKAVGGSPVMQTDTLTKAPSSLTRALSFKNGFSLISEHAKQVIQSIKVKTKNQSEKLYLPGTYVAKPAEDGGSSGFDEDGGSHRGTVGDDEISMTDSLFTNLDIYIDLTSSSFQHVTHPDIVCNETKLHTILQLWCEQLCLLLQEYDSSSGRENAERQLKAFHRVCPWKMTPEHMNMSKSLAHLCFTVGGRQALTEYQITGEVALVDYERTDVCLFMSIFWFLLQPSDLCKFIEQQFDGVKDMQNIWRCFISCIYESKKHERMWSSMILDSGSDSNALISVSAASLPTVEDDKPTLWLFTYCLARQDQFDKLVATSISLRKYLPPLHIMLVLQECFGDHKEKFGLYMERLLPYVEASQRKQFVQQSFQSKKLLTVWLDSLSTLQGHPRCSCGHPHSSNTANQKSHLSSVNTYELLSSCFPDDPDLHDRLLEIGEVAAWLRKYKQSGSRNDYMKVLLQSCDSQLMGTHLDGLLPLHLKDWESVFTFRSQQTSGPASSPTQCICLWCGSVFMAVPISWQWLANFMLMHISPADCMKVLSCVQLPHDALSPDFFSDCVEQLKSFQRERKVVENLMESVDGYLWKQHPIDLDPMMYAALTKEVEVQQAQASGSLLQQQIDELALLCERAKCSTNRYVEDGHVHWGRRISIDSVCPVCSISLCTPPVKSAVTVFQCGHAFHSGCCSHECSLCH